VVLVSLALATLFSFYGLWWGWRESFNPDEMAFRNVFAPRFLEPEDFQKPPFHTYLNFFLSVVPFKLAELAGKFITGHTLNFGAERLWWSRIIQVSFFLGTVIASYRIVARFAGAQGAGAIALIVATSAGFVVQTHFLTADEPVTFWMLASFYAAQSIAFDARLRHYVIAGLLVGIATATKYNGLAAGLAIPIFHLFAPRSGPLRWALFDRRLIVGVAMVPAAFVAANPYSILDFRRFADDFAYNYSVTPVYGGHGGFGFLEFLQTMPDIIGWPMLIVALAGALYALAKVREASLAERASVVAALGVFGLYFIQFGRAPRIETRFVLPAVPYVLIAAAPFWSSALNRYKSLATSALGMLIAYNALSCYWVGRRFADDPRMQAQAWVERHAAPHDTIESSQYTPHWELMPGIDVDDVRMPSVSGRAGILSHVFKSNASMMQEILRREGDTGRQWYRPEALEQRRPELIALDSKYFDRFMSPDLAGEDYPDVRDYMSKLLSGQLGYHPSFDATAFRSPGWLYPQDIDFLDNRIVILRRDAR
jgi:hypothetical protein